MFEAVFPVKKFGQQRFNPLWQIFLLSEKKQGSFFRQHWNGLRRSSRGKSGKKI